MVSKWTELPCRFYDKLLSFVPSLSWQISSVVPSLSWQSSSFVLSLSWQFCVILWSGGCVIGAGGFRRHTEAKEKEHRRMEFEAGHVHHEYLPLLIALSNLDNYWAVKSILDALRGLIPCSNPSCSHSLRRVDIDQRGSFVFQRACAAFPLRQAWYKGFAPGQSFVWWQGAVSHPMFGMIDKCGFERRACANSNLKVVLCDFHCVSPDY